MTHQTLPAAQVHQRLRTAIQHADNAQGEAAIWFTEVANRRLYRDLGHAGLEQYATEELDFSPNRFAQFRRLADDLARLPALREAMESGRLGWTKAQLVARAATPSTVDRWLARACRLGRRALARQVRHELELARQRRARARSGQLMLAAGTAKVQGDAGAVAPPPARSTMAGAVVASQASSEPSPESRLATADPPTTLSFRLDGLQRARYEALVERLRKQGHGGSREELLLAALSALVEAEQGSVVASKGPAVQVVLQRCPDCERTVAVTGAGMRVLGRAQAEAAVCDAVVTDPVTGHNRQTVPPAVRRQVLVRDGFRCRAPGCRAVSFLEVHHVVPRHRGGSNRPENLVTLCARCHAFLHEQGEACAGTTVQNVVIKKLETFENESRQALREAESVIPIAGFASD
jgi:5-methylcytosine-specific restriction endonuclease McrA